MSESAPAARLARLRTTVSAWLFGDMQTGADSLAFRLVAPIERRQAVRRQTRFCGKYVAVTGSVGKTTTSRMMGDVLRSAGSVAAGVYWGAERGILRTLRKLRAPTDFVVQEVSGHFPGAIRRITSNLRIDVAVVTTVGLDHQANFRARENVALEKGNLVEAVAPSGLVVLNADDPHVAGMTARAKARVVFYGRAASAEVRAENVTASWPERLSFDLVIGETRRRVETSFVGTIMLTNVLAVLAVVHGLGLNLDAAIARLRGIEGRDKRLEAVDVQDHHSYVADHFKASGWSTELLADDLKHWGQQRRIVVLGTMSDIGTDPKSRYAKALQKFAANSDLVIGTGRAATQAERLNKMHPHIVSGRTLADVRAILDKEPPSLVILKGSRGFSLQGVLPGDNATNRSSSSANTDAP